MGKHIRTLTVIYNTPITNREVPLFRGAVLSCMGDRADVLYHNHLGEKSFRYSYPLIQYKRINGNAAITCVEEGADIIGQFFSEAHPVLSIGEKVLPFEVARLQPARILVQTWKDSFKYKLHRWLPLNSKNFLRYKSLDNEPERIEFLENILKGNILSMLKGVGIILEDELIVNITQLSESYLVYNKGVGMTAYNAEFLCNLSIPNNLGIGKNASIGCGVIYQERNKQLETT